MPSEKSKGLNPALIISASAVGTAFEWYDFFLYGAVANILAKNFFSGVEPNLAYLFALLGFSAGFAVRPLGSAFFGRLGDRWGRKNTFLTTMLLMGSATILVGFLPTYRTIGVAAPILLIFSRIVQGFAVGGEYGGAAVYIAEHAPEGRRGFYTSFIQVTCTFGLFLALTTVLAVRSIAGEEEFAAWAWRLPFMFSAVLLLISLWIRLKLLESPVFDSMRRMGSRSRSPLRDLVVQRNLRKVLVAFSLSAGMTVVFYNSQVYSEFFMEKVLHVEAATANALVAAALLAATPFFVFFGWLSDRIGRKWIIVTGCLLAAVAYFPLFHVLANSANPSLVTASERYPVIVRTDPQSCSSQFDLAGRTEKTTACDIARTTLATSGVTYRNVDSDTPGGDTEVQIGSVIVRADSIVSAAPGAGQAPPSFESRIRTALIQLGYPVTAAAEQVRIVPLLASLFVMVLLVTMTYGPLAAILVECFPPSIRYSGVSIAYNIAVGWLGGFLPPIAFSLVTATGNIFSGLWYPVLVTGFFGLLSAVAVDDRRVLTRD